MLHMISKHTLGLVTISSSSSSSENPDYNDSCDASTEMVLLLYVGFMRVYDTLFSQILQKLCDMRKLNL